MFRLASIRSKAKSRYYIRIQGLETKFIEDSISLVSPDTTISMQRIIDNLSADRLPIVYMHANTTLSQITLLDILLKQAVSDGMLLKHPSTVKVQSSVTETNQSYDFPFPK